MKRAGKKGGIEGFAANMPELMKQVITCLRNH